MSVESIPDRGLQDALRSVGLRKEQVLECIHQKGSGAESFSSHGAVESEPCVVGALFVDSGAWRVSALFC